MLASMTFELQKQHKDMDAYTIVYHMREVFDELARSKGSRSLKCSFALSCMRGHL